MTIRIKVNTKSSKTEVVKSGNDQYDYIVRTNTVPENNKANIHIIKLLADYFHVSKNSITIIKGAKSKFKTISIYE